MLPFSPAPAAPSTATIAHGDARGSWLFVPGDTGLRAAVPGQSPAGAGWETGAMTGTIPAGTWALAADLTTTVPPGTAQGQVVAAVHAVGADGSRLLGMPATGDVLGAGTPQALTLLLPLDEVVLRDERVVVEWYLTIARHQHGDAAASTSLTSSAGAEHLVLPGTPVPLPLVGPTRAAVTDPQDHRLTVTWRASSDDRVVAYEVRGGPTAGDLTPLGTVAAGDGGPYAFVVRDLPNREPRFFAVVGTDGDGQPTPASNVTQGRALDRTPPDAPAAPTVAPAGTGVLNLAWVASIAEDLAGYEVERAATATGPFVTIARDLTDRTLDDEGLPPATTWWYRVRAVDDDGLRSEPSDPASTTTAPAVPTGLRIASTGDRSLTLAWDGSSRDLAGYRVERATGTGAFVPVGTLVTATSFTDTGLQNGTTYRYRVAAEDRRPVPSSWSSSVSGTPRVTAAPAPPTFLVVTDAARGAALEWGPSPTRDVVGYRILRSVEGGAPTEVGGLRTGRTYTDRDVVTGTRYEYRVVAVDAEGRRSAPSTAVTYVVQPAAPRSLSATASGLSTVTLTWTVSDDASARYEVWRAEAGGSPALIARTDATRLEDAGLLLETTYRYFVRAVSAGFRASPASNTVEVTLRDGPPSAPVVTAMDTTEGGSIELRWEPPEERDVTSWRVERRVAGDARWDVVADVPQPLRSYLDDGLTDGVRYEYRLVAVDRGGAESPPSAVTSAVPSDTTPPPSLAAPSVRLTVGALAVDWDVAPTAVRYEVLRATSPDGPFTLIATTSLRTVRDPDVEPGVTYHYRVVAFDEHGNASPPSDVGSGTFHTSVSPGSVVPVRPGPGAGTAAPGTGAGDPLPAPATPNPFDPTRPVLPPGFAGAGSLGADVGGGGSDRPVAAPAPTEDRSILAFPPELGGLREAVSAGDLPGAVGRVIGEVAGNVPDVARTFSIPLLLVVVILLYLMAQGRMDRDAAILTVEAPAGGDEDDVEFLL